MGKHIPKFMTDSHFGLENTPGTGVSPDATLNLPFTRTKINDDPEYGDHQGPGAGMDHTAQYMNRRAVGYETEGEVDIDAIGYIFANAYAGYSWLLDVHSWAGGTWEPSDASTVHIQRRQPWTLWESPKDFGNATTVNRKAEGCVGSRLEIHGEEGKALTFKVNGIGFRTAKDTAASVASEVPTQSPVMHGHGAWTLKIGAGTDHTVVPDEFTLVMEGNVKGVRDAVIDANFFDTNDFMGGLREHTLQLKLATRSPYAIDLLNYLQGPRTDTFLITATFTLGAKLLKFTWATMKINGGDPIDENTKDEEPHSFDLNLICEGTVTEIDLTTTVVGDGGYYYTAA